MAWPNRSADAHDVWPTDADLAEWVKDNGMTSSVDRKVLGDAFRTADTLIRSRLDAELLTARASAAGIVTDEDAVDYDEDVLHAWCPPYVRQAILIRGAAIYVRRQSPNGIVGFQDFAVRVRALDPDVDDLLAPVSIPGVA